jgi:two-component sensor histidine kinase
MTGNNGQWLDILDLPPTPSPDHSSHEIDRSSQGPFPRHESQRYRWGMKGPAMIECEDRFSRTRPKNLSRAIVAGLIRMLWQQPLWAIPFALFFGTLFGRGLMGYWRAYQISLVFAFSIRVSLQLLEWFGLPALALRFAKNGRLPIAIEASSYAIASILGSYLAAWVVHVSLMPGFLGSPRAFLISGAFALLFTVTIGGVIYATVFYRESLARARAIESMRVELAQAELRALRAQVNPHFLFNTLNTIASLITINPAAAEDTTTRLAEVFRYALRGSEHEHARLADELAFLRAYLAIEHTRFGNRLRIEERIEPGLESAPVPSLLLQPLVENAVRYAISPRPDGGTISLLARREEDRLVIEVHDDGPGFNGAEPASGTGFGLHSVRERLRAAGPPHAIEIDSAPGRGTRIRITLPLIPSSSTTSHTGVAS